MRKNNQKIQKYLEAQSMWFDIAMDEISSSKKDCQHLWLIFPQLKQLWTSETARYYGLENLEEAKSYLDNKILKERLIAATTILLNNKETDIKALLSFPYNIKVQSCMTLFDLIATETVFEEVLRKYYDGERDLDTLRLLESQNKHEPVYFKIREKELSTLLKRNDRERDRLTYELEVILHKQYSA